jgi:hypothetical protein
MVFTGLAPGTEFLVKDMALSFAYLEQELISGSTTAIGHLGIDELVHGTGNRTIPASHTEVGIYIDAKRE